MVLEDVAHAQHDDGVAYYQHSLAAVFAGYHLGRAAQPQDDVAPAFAARRPVIELAKQPAELGLVRELFSDPHGGEPVEDSELFFAESLVDDEGVGIFAHAGGFDDETGGVSGPEVGRSKHDVRSLVIGKGAEPASEGGGLPLSELGEGNVDIADVDVDHAFTGFDRGVAGDVARRFAVPHDVQTIWPDLIRFHGPLEVKERTISERSSPDQHDPDWPRYPETILRFSFEPALEIDLREVPSQDALSQLQAAGFGAPFAVLTAFDPRGQDLPRTQNEQRKRDLNRLLAQLGYQFVDVDACSPDGSHCECSVAVVMEQAAAIDLARELEQVAIFWFDGKQFWIMGAIVKADPLMLPRSS